LSLLSNQESKAEAVGCNTAAPVVGLYKFHPVETHSARKRLVSTLAPIKCTARCLESVIAEERDRVRC
jgi:hypothetical protein